MNIFERRDMKLLSDITNFATDIRQSLTYNPTHVAIEMDINVDILKSLDYWSISKELVTKYVAHGKITTERLELESMTVLSVALGDTRIRQARLRYIGELEEEPRRELINLGRSIDWGEYLRDQPLVTFPSEYILDSQRGRRSNSGEWRFENHNYGMPLTTSNND